MYAPGDSSNCDLAAPPVHGAACGGCVTSTVTNVPLVAFTVPTPKMEVLEYLSCFRYWLNDRRFLSMALKGVRPNVLI